MRAEKADGQIETDQRPNVRAWGGTYALAVLLVVLTAWPTLYFPFGRDQGIHATIGFALGEGLVTYSDVYNIKPPLTTAVHWLSQAVFGHSMASIRAMDMVFAVFAVLGLVSITRRTGLPPVAGGFTAFGFTLIYYSQSYWSNAQTDEWAGFLVVGAVVAMLSGWARPAGTARTARMGLAGVALGLAFALKYTIGGAGILIFAPLVAGLRGQFRLSDFAAVTIGGLVVLGFLALVLAATGALAPFLEIQNFVRGYVGYSASAPALQQVVAILQPVTLVAVTLGGLAWLWGVRRGEARCLHAIVPLWLAAGAVSGLVQGKGFGYHFMPLVPPFALLVGLAGWRFFELLRSIGAGRPVVTAALVAVLVAAPSSALNRLVRGVLALPEPAEAIRVEIGAGSDFHVREVLEFNEQLSSHRAPGDSLFVWGYETMLYYLQKEPPRHRYPYAWPFAVSFYDGRYTDDLIARLEDDPPAHIVVQKRDATPWVTGRALSSNELLEEFEALSSFLQFNYRLVETHPRFELWERIQ